MRNFHIFVKAIQILAKENNDDQKELQRCQPYSRMQVVEVLDHHVSRTVDDWVSLNHLKVI